MCGICEAMDPDGGECSSCRKWFRSFDEFTEHGYFGGCPEWARWAPTRITQSDEIPRT